MVPRLAKKIELNINQNRFWIKNSLKRRGIIGGKYEIILDQNSKNYIETRELVKPFLIKEGMRVNPSVNAVDNVEKDIIRLLEISLNLYNKKKKSHWKNILPIYPTSPVNYK